MEKDSYKSIIEKILKYGRSFKQLDFDNLFDDKKKLSNLIEDRKYLYGAGKNIEMNLLDNQKSEKLSFEEEEAVDYLEKYVFCGYGKKAIYSSINNKLKSLEEDKNINKTDYLEENKKKTLLKTLFNDAIAGLSRVNLNNIENKDLDTLSKLYSAVQILFNYSNYLDVSSDSTDNVKYISDLANKISSNYNIKVDDFLKKIKIKEDDFYATIYEPLVKDSCIKKLGKQSNKVTEEDIVSFLKSIGNSRVNYIKGNYEKDKSGKIILVES